MIIENIEDLFASFKGASLPKNFVKTKRMDNLYKRKALSIQIGNIEITILELKTGFEHLNCGFVIEGAGTYINDAVKWEIKKWED